MKKFKKIILGILALLVLIIAGAGIYITKGLEAGAALVINRVNVSQLNDGIYNGKYDGGRWSNEVNVTILDGRITKIDIVKSVLVDNPETTKALINSVISKQDTNIDVISGATVTSKAYLKSIENALNK